MDINSATRKRASLAGACALLSLALAATPTSRAAAQTSGANLVTMDRLYDGQARPDDLVFTLSHTDQLMPVGVARRAGPVHVLARRSAPFPAIVFQDKGARRDLSDYLSNNRVAGLLVLKNGEIAYEDYELGATPATRWASFSMAKSVTSTLTAAAIRDGYIKSIDDPADLYVPALKKGAYAGVSIRNILLMSSGAAWNETYTDPASDRRKLLTLQLNGKPDQIIPYMSGLGRAAPQGTRWNYSTGETFVLGAVVEGATHRPLTQYLSEKIWAPAGMEADATWWRETPGGMGLAGSGLGAVLRDYGRFGLLVEAGGRISDNPFVPDGWFAEAGRAHRIGDKDTPYGYMWWTPELKAPEHEGAFYAVGIFGQFIYVQPKEHVVIVVLSARSKPSEAGRLEVDDEAFFAAVVKALHGS